MKNDNKSNNDYFEIKKINMDDYKKLENKQKASIIRRSIAMAVLSITTSVVFGMKGYNPFLAFAQLFTLPIGMLVYSNVKILSMLKKEKMKIMNESKYDNENNEINNRGRKK